LSSSLGSTISATEDDRPDYTLSPERSPSPVAYRQSDDHIRANHASDPGVRYVDVDEDDERSISHSPEEPLYPHQEASFLSQETSPSPDGASTPVRRRGGSSIAQLPFSLWEYLQDEIKAVELDGTTEFRSERVSNFFSVPMAVEKVRVHSWPTSELIE